MFERLGRYQVSREIAVSDFASVHRAYLTTNAGVIKPVTLRRLLPAFRNTADVTVDLLVEEARIRSVLEHPNIAAVLDVDRQDGEWFIVEERVLGQDLGTLIRRARQSGHRIDPHSSLYIALQLLDALAHAHERTDAEGNALGIVHRDICPRNVLVGYGGEIKLTGFAYAKLRARPSPPPPGFLHPRYEYVSPEQALGAELDHRGDLFSVGLIAWELLAGVAAYESKTDLEALARAQRGQVRSIGDHAPGISMELRSSIDRALAADRQQRHASASAFRDELARIMYMRDPTYSASRITSLMAHLFQEQLAQERALEREERAALASTRSTKTPPPSLTSPRIPAPPTSSTSVRPAPRQPSPSTSSSSSSIPPSPPIPAAPPPPPPPSSPSLPPPSISSPQQKMPAPSTSSPKLPPATAPQPAPSFNGSALLSTTLPAAPALPPLSSTSSVDLPAPAPVTYQEKRRPIGKIILGAVLLVLIGLTVFTFSSSKNKRAVERTVRAIFIGRQPGGALTIESLPPKAHVWIDDEDTGHKTPMTVQQLESGVVHDVRLVLPGDEVVSSTVSIKPGAKATLMLTFPNMVVPLIVKSEPVGAEVWINNRDAALTPAELFAPVGEETTIRLSRHGYVDHAQAVTAQRGTPIVLDIKMEKTQALLEAEAAEAEAIRQAQEEQGAEEEEEEPTE